ncbi:MAG: hypothetical protein AAF657_00380 [Acidobacteriota bacterium]
MVWASLLGPRDTIAGGVGMTEPHFRNERSIAIAAAPEDVWPWLAQMGFGRAGWYSWDLIDNLGRRSATELRPEWMIDRPGDPIPGGPLDFETRVVDNPNHLVIAVDRRPFGPWTISFALSYRLRSTDRGCSLETVATGRIDGPAGRAIARHVLGPGDAFMVRKQLRGIRDRSER